MVAVLLTIRPWVDTGQGSDRVLYAQLDGADELSGLELFVGDQLLAVVCPHPPVPQLLLFALLVSGGTPSPNTDALLNLHPIRGHRSCDSAAVSAKGWDIGWGVISHLSKGTSCHKQNCTQTLTSFLGRVFHALSHGVIYFVPCVSSKNIKMEVSDWLLKNYNQWESVFLT